MSQILERSSQFLDAHRNPPTFFPGFRVSHKRLWGHGSGTRKLEPIVIHDAEHSRSEFCQ